MKSKLLVLSLLLFLIQLNVSAQITSAASGNWSSPGTWVGGVVPTSTNDVIIAPGHTVAVDNANAVCNNISFGDATSKLDMNTAASVLSVYGNFTVSATGHAVFLKWATGAKIKFTGATATQTIGGAGFPANNPALFSFMELIVDKPVGAKVITGGGGIRIGIGTSLEVVSGTFELTASDDIEGRSLTGTTVGGPFMPTITVQTNGTFRLGGVNSHIRSGINTGDNDSKIGKMTVYGFVSFTSGQANRLNFNDIDIFSGGTVEMRSSGTVAATLNTGTVTVKSGGLFKSATNVGLTANYWYSNATTPNKLDIQGGGELDLNTDKTDYLPQEIVLNPDSYVRYSFATAGQNLSTRSDMAAYSNLILLATTKTLTRNISVSDTLFMRTNSTLAPSIVLGAFSLTYGSNATLQYRGVGIPPPAQSTTDIEWPNSGSKPANVSIYNSSMVALNNSKSISGTLSFSGDGSKLILGANTISAADVTGFSSAKYVVTDGAGSLTIRGVGATAKIFPIGISASLYQPITIANNGTVDDFSAKVAAGTPCGLTASATVNCVWNVTEATPGGSNANVIMQWNGTDENAGFTRTLSNGVACNNASVVTATGSASTAGAGGTDFYTQTLNDVSDFYNFGVKNSSVDLAATTLIAPIDGGCKTPTETVTVSITNNAEEAINFSSTNATVTVTATGGYSSSVDINTGTLAAGASQNITMPATIDLSAGGTFVFNASVSVAGDGNASNNAMAPVTVNALPGPNATISYSNAIFCTSTAIDQPITLTGTTGGVFSSAPAGLSLNTTTGSITPSTSATGTYTVAYKIAAGGGCPQLTTTATVTIANSPAATFSYGLLPFCNSQTTIVMPAFTGTTSGTFTSITGLTINASTGAIKPSTSTPGTYTVIYSIPASGSCPVLNATASVTIEAAPSAIISYAGSPFCTTSGTVNVIRTGTTGGIYSSTTGLTIDASTGTITPATSTAGTYIITYTIPAANSCANFTTTTTVVINKGSVAPTGITSSLGTSSCGAMRTNLSIIGGTLATGANWVWYTGSCGGTNVGSGASINNVNVTANTTYYVRAEGGTCDNSACASLAIVVNPSIAADISYQTDSIVMPGKTVTLAANTTPASTNNTYEWYKNGVFVGGATASTLIIGVDNPGVYTVKVTTPEGCSAITTTGKLVSAPFRDKVWVYPNPAINGKFSVRYYNNRWPTTIVRSLVIYDTYGNRVYQKNYTISGPYTSMDVNVPTLQKGMYILSIRRSDGAELVNEKVLIQ